MKKIAQAYHLQARAWHTIVLFKQPINTVPAYDDKDGSNPYPAEFLKWNKPLSINGIVHYHFMHIKIRLKMRWMCRLAWLYTGGKD